MIVDLLMPPRGHDYAPAAAEHVGRYRAAFARAGLTLRPVPWVKAGAAPALALFAWGYHEQPERWLRLLDDWPVGLPLFNPAPLMRWNTCKTYLAELEAAGVPTVPTWFGDADPAAVGDAFERFQAEQIVVKPQVSASSHQTHRINHGDDPPSMQAAMIQPFLPAILDEGEYALFYIGGAFSHAIRKTAAEGDFRVQPQFGGRNAPWKPDAEARAVAEAALRAAPPGAACARIDLVRRRGRLPPPKALRRRPASAC
jgi:hypothetical protein